MASNSKTNNAVPCTVETSEFVNCNTSYVNWLIATRHSLAVSYTAAMPAI